MALPGSKLYFDAVKNNVRLPDSYEGYSFHSEECIPLPTDTLSASEVLQLRDEAFKKYHNYKPFLRLIEKNLEKSIRKYKRDVKINTKRKYSVMKKANDLKALAQKI